jgi:hypothetical protein
VGQRSPRPYLGQPGEVCGLAPWVRFVQGITVKRFALAAVAIYVLIISICAATPGSFKHDATGWPLRPPEPREIERGSNADRLRSNGIGLLGVNSKIGDGFFDDRPLDLAFQEQFIQCSQRDKARVHFEEIAQ